MNYKDIIQILILPMFIIFVWHTELYMATGNVEFTNGFIYISAQQMYHIIMYICIGLYLISTIIYITERGRKMDIQKLFVDKNRYYLCIHCKEWHKYEERK